MAYKSPNTWRKAKSGKAVVPPDPVEVSVGSSGTLGPVTFGSFLDRRGIINSYSAAVTNLVGSATISGSGLGPYTISGAADGESIVITLSALDSSSNVLGHATWSGTQGTSSGGGSWIDLRDLDLTDLTTTGNLAHNKNHSLSFQSSGDTLDLYRGRTNSSNGTCTPTNGSGLVFYGGTGNTGDIWAAFDLHSLLSSYTNADIQEYDYAFHFVITNLSYQRGGYSDFRCSLGRGSSTGFTNTTRGLRTASKSDGTTENIQIYQGGTIGTATPGATIKTSRVVTLILQAGSTVRVMDTSGTTPPIPAAGSANTYSAGTNALGFWTAPYYRGSYGLHGHIVAEDRTDFTLTRILIQRFE